MKVVEISPNVKQYTLKNGDVYRITNLNEPVIYSRVGNSGGHLVQSVGVNGAITYIGNFVDNDKALLCLKKPNPKRKTMW